jgi:arylsulfatase A
VSDAITRREALRRLGSVVAGGAVALAAGPRLSRAAGALRPNIIFILADDLGYGDLGCYGQTRIRTPNLDAMAVGGMRFTSGYAGAVVCAPSRCSLMTGLHTGHTHVRRNENLPLGLDDVTVADVLQGAGYATGFIGKWHLGGSSLPGQLASYGFDYFLWYWRGGCPYYPVSLCRNTHEFLIPGNQDGQRGCYAPGFLTQDALRFMEEHAAGPFFLYLAYPEPHISSVAYKQDGNARPVPTDAPYTNRPWPQEERNYAAMVTRMDTHVGRLVGKLEELGIHENTLVLFASDNGPSSGYGHTVEFFGSNGLLRGGKRELYEGGIRVPMIAYWPGHVPPGAVSDKPTAFWDFLPTAAELAGAAPPAGTDGISMVRTLLGQDQRGHDSLYWESYESPDGMAQAVRLRDWKGLRPAPGSPLEVYDLSTDLGETTDVAARFPGVVAQISDIMLAGHGGSAPRLSWSYRVGFHEDAVEPDMGLPNETSFHFEVRVLDLDGDEPDFVRLTLYRDGVEWSTRDLTRSDSVTRRGRRYSCVRKLPPGNYAYLFATADADGGARLPLLTPKVGPILPCYPYLVWTGESGYEGDGVEPHTGDAGSTPFRFRVKYRAHDSDYADYVKLTLWRDGTVYRTCQMKPSPQTNDPVAGMVYFIARLLPAGDYEYQFQAADQHGKAVGPASVRMGGLTVASGAAAVTGLAAAPTRGGGAQVTFSLSTAAEVSVVVTNLAGRPVATVTGGARLAQGLQTVVWNGMSAHGLPVPNGTYIIRVATHAPDGAVSRAVTTCSIRR